MILILNIEKSCNFERTLNVTAMNKWPWKNSKTVFSARITFKPFDHMVLKSQFNVNLPLNHWNFVKNLTFRLKCWWLDTNWWRVFQYFFDECTFKLIKFWDLFFLRCPLFLCVSSWRVAVMKHNGGLLVK